MPGYPHNSNGSPTPSAKPFEKAPESREGGRQAHWSLHVALFVATAVSMYLTFLWSEGASAEPARVYFGVRVTSSVFHALQFTGSLLAILLAHEFGHYFAAKAHGVSSTLPFFIPLPFLSPFGTMGAVIRIRSPIPHRAALLDIGASGPLAGLFVALPLYAWGVAHSKVVELASNDGVQLGESLLTRVLDRSFGPTVPPGMDIEFSPVAFAAWAGMLVTMLNLLPVGQLDGGHVGYALLRERHNRFATLFHRCTFGFFVLGLAGFLLRDAHRGFGLHHLGVHVSNSIFWLVWFEFIAILGTAKAKTEETTRPLTVRNRVLSLVGLVTLSALGRNVHRLGYWAFWFIGLALLVYAESRWGAFGRQDLADHPDTEGSALGPFRRAVAIVSLALFVLLFMPFPILT